MAKCSACYGVGDLPCDCDPDDTRACALERDDWTGQYRTPRHSCTACAGTGVKQFRVTIGDVLKSQK